MMTRRRFSLRKRPVGRDGVLGAFSLTEMLVVMGICAVLAVLLVPVLLRARSKARGVVCLNNLKGLGQAYTVSLTNSAGYMPETYYVFSPSEAGDCEVTLRALSTDTPDGLFEQGHSGILACPSDPSPANVLALSLIHI